MAVQRSPVLPNELIIQISDELIGEDLFRFTLAVSKYFHINNEQILRFLRKQPKITMIHAFHDLIFMAHSPYMRSQDGISLVLRSCEWLDCLHGGFSITAIQKSLKYFSTTVFFVYARLWSFNPFFYDPCYPTLDIFKDPSMLKL